MAITLNNVTFNEALTVAQEKHAEVGGRDAREIVIHGLVLGASNMVALHAALDAILDAASAGEYTAALSLRPGRRLWVRREAFERNIAADVLVGSFKLTLSARDPFEEAIDATEVNWTIDHSGDALAVSSVGNIDSQVVISITAAGDLIKPAVSDGTRQITYNGTVPDGSVIVFDGSARKVMVDGADMTPYTAGDFPAVSPEGTVITYTDDDASAHAATAVVLFRDRWW